MDIRKNVRWNLSFFISNHIVQLAHKSGANHTGIMCGPPYKFWRIFTSLNVNSLTLNYRWIFFIRMGFITLTQHSLPFVRHIPR